MTYNFRNHVAENSFSRNLNNYQITICLLIVKIILQKILFKGSLLQVEHEQVAGHNMTFNYRNHVVKNIFATVRKNMPYGQLFYINLCMQCGRDVLRTNAVYWLLFQEELRQLPGHHLASDSGNHAAENIFPGEELRQLPGHHLASDSGNHAAENIFPGEELRQLPGHHLASDSGNHAAENIFPGD
ncbi:uncharacterized protein LOC127900920 isoform X3 [Citrus sinensis]|uniref:uncharacterized protein LOC127900920 isoform X3 n=1 Tax=Citrus sinensis TaxID=2711 RepID=UPI0022781BFF|nr:uncharacterized protein LOC127900920 isoform X3 [Citrus sinensis]